MGTKKPDLSNLISYIKLLSAKKHQYLCVGLRVHENSNASFLANEVWNTNDEEGRTDIQYVGVLINRGENYGGPEEGMGTGA